MSYDELLASAVNYIVIARKLKREDDKVGAIVRYRHAIQLLQTIAKPGNQARLLLDQTTEELQELTSQEN